MQYLIIIIYLILTKIIYKKNIISLKLNKTLNDCPTYIKNKYPYIMISFNDKLLYKKKYYIPYFNIKTENKNINVPQIWEGLSNYNISYHSNIYKSIYINDLISLRQTAILRFNNNTIYKVGIQLSNNENNLIKWTCTYLTDGWNKKLINELFDIN